MASHRLGQGRRHRPLQRLRLHPRGEALDHPPVAADQELGEVPLDRPGAEQSRLFLLEVGEQRLGLRPVDLDLGQQREGDVVCQRAERAISAASRAPGRRTGCRENPGSRARLAVAAPQLFQPLVLRGEAAGRGGVDDEQHLARYCASGWGAPSGAAGAKSWTVVMTALCRSLPRPSALSLIEHDFQPGLGVVGGPSYPHLILRCGRSKIAEPRRRAPDAAVTSGALLRGQSIFDRLTPQDEVGVGCLRLTVIFRQSSLLRQTFRTGPPPRP